MLHHRLRLLMFLFFCMIPAADLAALELYKYRDNLGRWVFTDRKPSQTEYEKQKLVVTEQQKKVAVVNRGTRERPVLFAVNQLAGPVEIWLEFSKQQNLRFSQQQPFNWVVDGPGEVFLLQIEKADPSLPWSYEWQANFAVGRPVEPLNLDNSAFGVPFAGGPYVISQGFFGEYSHKDHAHAHYAIDVPLPMNTPILAAREGKVMEVESRFSRSGWNMDYADEANLVRLLHADGSMTIYAHLNVNSVVVEPGQQIRAGQVLGYSGNTGFSSGPHLHFAWQANIGQTVQSLPFQFKNAAQAPVAGLLLQGETLR